MRLLVTGGAGFIGANFVHVAAREHAAREVHHADGVRAGVVVVQADRQIHPARGAGEREQAARTGELDQRVALALHDRERLGRDHVVGAQDELALVGCGVLPAVAAVAHHDRAGGDVVAVGQDELPDALAAAAAALLADDELVEVR